MRAANVILGFLTILAGILVPLATQYLYYEGPRWLRGEEGQNAWAGLGITAGGLTLLLVVGGIMILACENDRA